MPKKKPTAAIYARVSTHEQTPKNQLRDLTAYAKKRGFRVAHELVEKESGANHDRAQLNFLMELARKRQIDLVLVWKFDRFARSTSHLLSALEEFRGLGVDFISYTENVDTSTPLGKVVFTMVSAIAEFERDLIRERVKAGLARARAIYPTKLNMVCDYLEIPLKHHDALSDAQACAKILMAAELECP